MCDRLAPFARDVDVQAGRAQQLHRHLLVDDVVLGEQQPGAGRRSSAGWRTLARLAARPRDRRLGSTRSAHRAGRRDTGLTIDGLDPGPRATPRASRRRTQSRSRNATACATALAQSAAVSTPSSRACASRPGRCRGRPGALLAARSIPRRPQPPSRRASDLRHVRSASRASGSRRRPGHAGRPSSRWAAPPVPRWPARSGP